jgi:hypothetical protein
MHTVARAARTRSAAICTFKFDCTARRTNESSTGSLNVVHHFSTCSGSCTVMLARVVGGATHVAGICSAGGW